jgi:SAM-dependent methyltransferase
MKEGFMASLTYQSLSDPNYVRSQYQTASNLNARIRLHQLFSTNPYGWQRWLFDQFKFPAQGRILELGCGDGILWRENLDRIPPGLEFLITDLSAGMVQQAQKNLSSHSHNFQFKGIDAQSLPWDDPFFDVVIANHMLYHVPDRAKALAEIRRVLKPGGRFFASTVGENHLKEMNDLVSKFDPQLAARGQVPADSFTLENGAAQLMDFFDPVLLYRYPDSLAVTDAAPLTEYILSWPLELPAGQQASLGRFVRQALQQSGGKLVITKDSGLFEAGG